MWKARRKRRTRKTGVLSGCFGKGLCGCWESGNGFPLTVLMCPQDCTHPVLRFLPKNCHTTALGDVSCLCSPRETPFLKAVISYSFGYSDHSGLVGIFPPEFHLQMHFLLNDHIYTMTPCDDLLNEYLICICYLTKAMDSPLGHMLAWPMSQEQGLSPWGSHPSPQSWCKKCVG